MTLQQTISLQNNLLATLRAFYKGRVEMFQITPKSPWTIILRNEDGSKKVIGAPTQLEALRAAILA